MNQNLSSFFSGLIAMEFVIIGLYFTKFWRETRDFLFIAFAVAFWLLAANTASVAVSQIPRQEQSWTYLLRFLAFLVIIIAILAKNLGGRGRRGKS